MDEFKKILQDGLDKQSEKTATMVKEEVKKVSEDVTKMSERIERLENAPLIKQSVGINLIPKHYKGYNLSKQLANARNLASHNPSEFPIFSSDEKSEDFAKFMIAMVKSKRFNDVSAIADIKEFYQKTNQNQEDTDSEGGYLVPDEYSFDMIKLAREMFFALRECTIVPMGTDSLKIPAELTLASVAWTNEEGDITAGEPTFSQLALTAKRLDGYARVTNELLQDSNIDIAGILAEQFSYAINEELDNQVLNGTGSPVSGVLTAKAGYSIVLSGDAFSTVTGTNLSEAIQKIVGGYQAGAKWAIGTMGYHLVRSLKDSQNAFIFSPIGGQVSQTIWGFPIIVSSKITNTTGASTAFIVFGNFKKFYIGRRIGSMSLDVDPYGLFTTNATRFRMVTRWGLGVGIPNAFCRVLTSA